MSNFLSIYNHAVKWCAVERAQHFYQRQNDIARAIAEEYRLDLERVCAMLAVMSPGARWSDIYDAVRKVIKGETFGIRCYGTNVEKARRIFAGEQISDWLRGPKVTCFFHNIFEPADDRFITIDGHMYCIWSGRRQSLRNLRYEHEIKKALYDRIANDLRRAAKRAGMAATAFQAVVWYEWRRIHMSPQEKLFYSEKDEDLWR